MAVAAHHRFAPQLAERKARRRVRQELREEKHLPGKTLRLLIVRQQVRQLLAEHGDARRLETDDRRAGADVRIERAEDALQISLPRVEQAELVERAAATERPRRHVYLATGRSERLGRGARPFRV